MQTPHLAWQANASCLDHVDLFDLVRAGATQLRQAAEICHACPVRKDCDDLAYQIRPTWGVWAGRLWQGSGPLGRPRGEPT